MDPYSCLHTYVYQGKPKLIKTVDLIFSPVRAVFKGKTVDLLTGKETLPAPSWVNSPQMKVAFVISLIALSVLYPPIGIVFAICPVLKAACCLWEKKKVIEEITRNSEVISLFQKNFNAQNYADALSNLELNPYLAVRWKKELLVIGNQFAKSENTVRHLPKLAEINLKNHDSIRLFRHIVETKFKKDMIRFDLKHIEQWIKNLHLGDGEALAYCNSVLDLFKPEDNDPFLTKMIKLNAGISIIRMFENFGHDLPIINPGVQAENNPKVIFQLVREKIKRPKNFDGTHIKKSLLSNIDSNKLIYAQLLDSPGDCEHLSYLISAIRCIKNLEAEIDKVFPQLNEDRFDPKNPVENLKYKKKILSQAKLFLEKLETLYCKQQRKRSPPLSKQLVYFLKSKRTNIDSNCEFYKKSLKMAEELLTQSEKTFIFNAVKFKLSLSDLSKEIFGEKNGELSFPSNNPIHELYREYYRIPKKQFDFTDKVFDLICHNVKQAENVEINFFT